MRTLLALVSLGPLLPLAAAGAHAQDAAPARPATAEARRALLASLDRIYTWGDLVETFTCRVHGWWLTYGDSRPDAGHFWGDLHYRKGRLRLTIDRTLGTPRDRRRAEEDIRALLEQAGLLPTGFPLPPGEVRRIDMAGRAGAGYRLRGADRRVIDFRVRGERLVEVTVPRAPGARPPVALAVHSRWIPGDRYLVTAFVGRPGMGPRPRVLYDHHLLAGNYFPHVVTEDRPGESLSLVFYDYRIDLIAP